MTMTASEETLEIRVPRARFVRLKKNARAAWSFFLDRVAPPMLGCFLGFSMAAALWLLFLLWWLGA